MAIPIADIFGQTGPIASALGSGYEPRPEQIEMAAAVARTLASKSHLVVEAGTGIGKSFAYLVPAILRCTGHGERVVVATNTIALQEQLVHKDVPLLREALESAGIIPRERAADGTGPRTSGTAVPLKPVLVKGRSNYVSIRRLKLASARQDSLLADTDARRQLHEIEDWAYATTDGTLATLPQLTRPEVWTHVESDADNCMGRRCPHFKECFYQRARREMESANLLICNHALFFSDLSLRMGGASMLPDYHHVILDEAHNVEDVAAEHLGESLSEGKVSHLLRSLFDARRGKGYLAQLARHPMAGADSESVNRAVSLTLAAGEAARMFFEAWWFLCESGQLPAGGGRVRTPKLVDNTLSPAMNELSLRLKALKDTVTQEADKFELNAYSQRAAAIAAAAEALVAQTLPDSVYWVEVHRTRGGHGRMRVELGCAPVEVGPILREHLFGKEFGVILTSATLAAGGGAQKARTTRKKGARLGSSEEPQRRIEPESSEPPTEATETARPPGAFAHVISRLGTQGADTLLLGSPFEYARQVKLFIHRGMPDPRVGAGGGGGAAGQGGDGEPGAYITELAARILEHVDATDGGAFVLFTSFGTLNSVAQALRGPLGQRGMPLLAQVPDGPRGELLRRFREDPRSVLLGAASFWQGVDVRGQALRNVIITRLPFEPPDRPLTEARLERIQERGGNPFFDESLPRAVIRFKQGFGRLIRSKTDTGRVVVLDPRIVTARYGKRFLGALPAGVEVVVK